MPGEARGIVVYGAGGHAKVVLDILELQGEYRIAGLIDDDPSRDGKTLLGYGILGSGEMLGELKASGVEGAIVAVGDNERRGMIAGLLATIPLPLITAIHPGAHISRGVTIGVGTAVMAGVVINADSVIGDNGIINTGVTVDHDCSLGTCVHLSPGVHVAGGVRIGDHSHVGIGAVVLPGLSIGPRTIVAAGSVVNRNLPPDVVAAGLPARPIRRLRASSHTE